jgi:hypothetical protein
MSPEDVDVWFKVNNIIPEKMDLYDDFTFSLYYLIIDTYLGDNDNNETNITISDDDNVSHFDWCWMKTIENFKKEEIIFNEKGEHYDYFFSFFSEIFYKQKEIKVKDSIGTFFNELFDRQVPFTKSDLDMISSIYKSLDKNMN